MRKCTSAHQYQHALALERRSRHGWFKLNSSCEDPIWVLPLASEHIHFTEGDVHLINGCHVRCWFQNPFLTMIHILTLPYLIWHQATILPSWSSPPFTWIHMLRSSAIGRARLLAMEMPEKWMTTGSPRLDHVAHSLNYVRHVSLDCLYVYFGPKKNCLCDSKCVMLRR